MKSFIKLNFDPKICIKELDELKVFLDSSLKLDEQKNILPFFRKRKHLSAFIGSYVPDILNFDLLAFEYSIFGDFASDLVIGDSVTGCYCFVEFEDASPSSIFVQKGNKATPEWSSRFEHGFSQIVDWFWKLSDMEKTVEFKSKFGRDFIKYYGMLIMGRSRYLEYKEQMRLKWRIDKVLVDSQKVICLTFDELYEHLERCLRIYKLAYLADELVTHK